MYLVAIVGTFNKPRRANTECFATLERCWASNWRARNQRDRGVNYSTLPSPPPLYARFVLKLWLGKCLIQRQWCGHVAQPNKVWEQQRTETILEEKSKQQFISVLNCPHLTFMVQQVCHIPRRGQGKNCTVPGIKRPTFLFAQTNTDDYITQHRCFEGSLWRMNTYSKC